MSASAAAFVTGEASLPSKGSVHQLEGRTTVEVSLATGDEATARVRWNRVHEQAEGLVQMGPDPTRPSFWTEPAGLSATS